MKKKTAYPRQRRKTSIRNSRQMPSAVSKGYEVYQAPVPGGLPGNWLPDAGELFDDLLDGLPFAQLDGDLPLLMLPVRIETRYELTTNPVELRIRIYPDQIHIDTDNPSVSGGEKEQTIAFWTRWHQAKTPAAQQRAWRTFVRRVGDKRAGYLARLLRPSSGKDGKLDFPEEIAQADRIPGRPRFLPRQWLALGYQAGQQLFSVESRPVAPDLRTGPDPSAAVWESPDRDLKLDDGLAWMVDYERALDVGMAITVPITPEIEEATIEQLDVLLVLGVDHNRDPLEVGQSFARHLDAHARTEGLAFVPQGAPTNNTETVASGWQPGALDMAELADRELGEPVGADNDNADRLAKALGLQNRQALRRLEHGSDSEALRSQSMRAAAYEAVCGTLVRQLLDVPGSGILGDISGEPKVVAGGLQPQYTNPNAISTEAMNNMRSWFVDHVTGGAPVPTLRVGKQPYGILPVRRSVTEPDETTPRGQVERVVGLLKDLWRGSAASVPVLDSNLADFVDETGGTVESAIGTVLASQPHPARLFTRRIEDFESLNSLEQLVTVQGWYQAILNEIERTDPGTPGHTYVEGTSEAAAIYSSKLEELYPDGFTSIDDQIDLWTHVETAVKTQLTGTTEDEALQFIDSAFYLLDLFEERQRPLRWLGLDRFEGVLVGTEEEVNTKLIAGLTSAVSEEWGTVGLVQAPEGTSGISAAAYLADLRARFDGRDAMTGDLAPSELSWRENAEPLLHQLLAATLDLVPNTDDSNKAVSDALATLETLDPDTLEWLLRETLGLGAHRLDAWATSLASERLDRIRAKRPDGLQIGAFGWITQLQRRGSETLSEGFIHAPSMAHATTAALLRAGWHAHGSDDAGSAAATDIRSHRVRAATWLLDGVREGQALGDLLGYQFERSLHDQKADDQIRSVRKRVLVETGYPDKPPNQPVDGLDLLELARDGALDDMGPSVEQAVSELEEAFDAVNDVTLFESLHQLAAGNSERATAMMDSVSTCRIAPPELRAPRTPRSAITVQHRVLVLLDPDAVPLDRGWTSGLRDQIAPALEAWAGSLLPHADQVGFRVSEIKEGGEPTEPVPMTLAQLDLSALDAIYLVGDNPAQASPALKTLAASVLGSEAAVNIETAFGGDISLADFSVLAVELRRLIETARPADARDMRPSSVGGEADTDTGAALDQIEKLLDDFETLADDLQTALDEDLLADLEASVIRLARFRISLGEAPGNRTAAENLNAIVAQRRSSIEAIEVDSDNRQPGLEARLAAALTGRVPVLGRFALAGSQDRAVIDPANSPATPDEVDDWFDAVSRVRSELGHVANAGLLSELMGAGGLRMSAGQTPVAAGESWAATHAPRGPGRYSVLAIHGPSGTPGLGEAACGLMVDHWSEPVPVEEQITGLTFQYDAPSNRPPQAMLLAVPPDGEAWSLKLVADTLLETLEWASLRAVCPEDLYDYGRTIPTTFVPGTLETWPQEQS